MRMKKDKEKPHAPGQRHSSAAALYEVPAQAALLHDHPDEYVLELFEQMLVRSPGNQASPSPPPPTPFPPETSVLFSLF